MKIGIDCRMFGPKHTGIGRYVQNLVENLLLLDKGNEYFLFVNADSKNEIRNLKFEIGNSLKIENCKLKIVEANVNHYSLREQFLLPGILKREELDLMHFPHFNVPVFYRGKYVVTIHDLIKHTSKGKETTTRSSWLYWLKYLGYKFVFKRAVGRAEKIIVPSRFVRDEVIKEYRVKPEKVIVTYEGVDTKLKTSTFVRQSRTSADKQSSKLSAQYNIEKPFLLYVGSVYPHKNIERLIEAVKILNLSPITNYQSPITLVVVCARNVFSQRLSNKIEQIEAKEFVRMAGYVPDEDLAVLYKEAEAFIFPTLSEGFGLPGLEAMSLGCPVLCSDIPVLKEIYKDSAVYFNPLDISDISNKIKEVLSDKKLLEKLSKSGPLLAGTYSWVKTAKETLDVYLGF